MTGFRIYYDIPGGHVHMRVFAGEGTGAFAKAGTLVLREKEFEDLRWNLLTQSNIEFINEKSV